MPWKKILSLILFVPLYFGFTILGFMVVSKITGTTIVLNAVNVWTVGMIAGAILGSLDVWFDWTNRIRNRHK